MKFLNLNYLLLIMTLVLLTSSIYANDNDSNNNDDENGNGLGDDEETDDTEDEVVNHDNDVINAKGVGNSQQQSSGYGATAEKPAAGSLDTNVLKVEAKKVGNLVENVNEEESGDLNDEGEVSEGEDTEGVDDGDESSDETSDEIPEDPEDEEDDEKTTLANTPLNNSNGKTRITGTYESVKSKFFSIISKPGILAGIIGGIVIALLTAILLIMFIVYRMRKKDEGSYALEDTKKPLSSYEYRNVPTKEFYA